MWIRNVGTNQSAIIVALQGTYLAMRNLQGLMYAVYIVAITDTWHKLKKHKIGTALLLIPYILVVILLFINNFTHSIFYFDNTLGYVRGYLFLILYVLTTTYIVFGIIYIIKYRKLVRKDKIIAIILMVPFTITALLIQYYNTAISVEMFTGAVATLIIFIMVQRPEDYIEPYTGFKNDETYKEDIKRYYGSEKYVDIIIFNIKNYESIISMMGYEKEPVWLKIISERIISCLGKRIGLANIYYLGRGMFRLVVSGRNMKYTKQIAENIKSAFKENIQFYKSNINIVSTVCVVQNFVDIKSYRKFSWFDNEVEKVVPYSGNVVWAKDILSKIIF